MSLGVPIEVAPGDLIDRITILEIKAARLVDPGKLANVRTELDLLRRARDQALPPNPALLRLTAELRAVNETLWQIEEDIRACDAAGDFGPRFIELARGVYRMNDRRATLKREINAALGSRLVEEKSYGGA